MTGQRTATGEPLRRFQAITDAALSQLGVEDLLTELLARTRDLLDVDSAAVFLLDASGVELIATAATGLEEEIRQAIRVPLGAGFTGRIAATGKPIVLEHVDQTTVVSPVLQNSGIETMLGVPM